MLHRRRIAPQRQTSVNPTLVFALIAALVLAAAFAGNQVIKTQEVGSGPIDVFSATESFAAGDNIVVDDPAITGQSDDGGPRAVKEFRREEEFSLFALTWEGDLDVAAFVRAEGPDGTWGPWFDADKLGDMADNGKNGTELVYVEPTRAVQVNILGVDLYGNQAAAESVELETSVGGIAPVADIADLDVVFMDGNPQEGIELTQNSISYGMPSVVTRAGWGANESWRKSRPTYDNKVQAAAVHHTAGSNNYTRAQSAGIVRGIYAYHANNLNWGDVGYNALVDKYGTIYEGRYGGLDKAVQGAHVGGFNANTWGISMLGDYDKAATTPAMINSVGNMLGWKAAVSGFDPLGYNNYYTQGFNGSRYPAGSTARLPNIFGHRDAHNTVCPGQFGYAQMGTIRNIANQRYQQIKNNAPLSTPTHNTQPPVDSTPIIGNPGDSNPGSNNPGTRGNQSNQVLATLSSAAGGDTTALLTIVGTIAAIAITIMASNGSLPGGAKRAGDVEVLEGVSLSDLKPAMDTIVSMSSDSDISRTWNRVNATFGPSTLGQPLGGITATTNSEYAMFDNGIIINSEATGAHALWGVIGDTWAAQGFDLGPLGLPLNEEYLDEGLIRVDFESGYITFDPATGQPNVVLN